MNAPAPDGTLRTEALQIDRARLDTSRIVASTVDPDALADGAAWLAVQRLAVSANTLTYAVLGDRFHYWDAFPVGAGASPWGVLPAWGFADVVASRHPSLAVGERVFGFLPTATHLHVRIDRCDATGFVDAAPHRQALEAIYNRYQRCRSDPAYAPEAEPWIALFRPLVATAFLLDHFLRDHDFFGARQIVITSASSKTALATAHLLRESAPARLVGLTAPSRLEAVRASGCYDAVFGYPALESVTADVPTVYLDFAGDAGLRERLHRHLGDQLRHAALIGAAHGATGDIDATLPGVAPSLFFAPGVARRLASEIGGPELAQRIARCEAQLRTAIKLPRLVEHQGLSALEALYHAMRRGTAELDAGHLWQP